MSTKLTWLGHATFLFENDKGTVLVDPWLGGNPSCPEAFHGIKPDAILITHGHNDHIGDVFEVAERTDGPIVGIFDLTTWLAGKGVDEGRLVGMNKGGTIRLESVGLSVTMVDAVHSSSFVEADGTVVYLGEPAGYVLRFDDGSSFYMAGDTSLFGDMEWIGRLYEPKVAVLPIGDHFTMDPRAAAWACKLLAIDKVVPCHFGTFGLLTGTPADLQNELNTLDLNVELVTLEPGASADF